MNTLSTNLESLVLPDPRTVLDQARGKRLLIGFDFDGTLTPIVPKPDQVRFDEEAKRALHLAASAHSIVVCTGRSVQDLIRYAGNGPNLDVIGNHGAEWRIRGQDLLREIPGWSEFRQKVLPEIQTRIAQHGGDLEDKHQSVTIHFRHAGQAYWPSVETRNWLQDRTAGTAQLIGGLAAWNVVPLGVSKGEAMRRYMEERGFDRLVYFGDEETDESVFRLGAQGGREVWGVKVGEGASSARYRLPDVPSVLKWLVQLSMLDSGLM